MHARRPSSRRAPAPPGALVLCALGALGCEPEPEPEVCAVDDAPQVLVLRTLSFSLADEAGLSDGFDLDGVTTVENGPDGCGIADYTGPDGTPGIDNAFSRLVPALNSTEAKLSVIEGLVQSAIDSGELLITLELGSLDSWERDDCVAGEVGQALGTPMLGTDGRILDGQTFDRDTELGTVPLSAATVHDGVLEGSGLSIDLPVQILNANLLFPLREGRIRLEPSGDDGYRGLLAGKVSAAYVLSVAQTENVDPTVAELLGVVLTANSDFDDEDGTYCGAISVTLAFEAVGAWYYEE